MTVHHIHTQAAPATFEDLVRAYPRTTRTKPAAARMKFNAIISPDGLTTRNHDHDSGGFIEVHLQATPEEIIRGAKMYAQEMRIPESYKFSEYTQGLQNWLNQGKWMNYE